MKHVIILAAFLALVAPLSSVDRTRIVASMDTASLDSLKTAYQMTVSRSILKQDLPSSTCAFVADKTQLTLEDLYYASFISKIQSCTVNIAGVEEFLRGLLKEDAPIKTIYKAASALHNFNFPLEESLLTSVTEALKNEDTVMAHSLAYLTASVLPGEDSQVLLDSIEDVAHRADTVGSTMSFDGGIMETSMFLKGAFALAQKAGKPALPEAMVKKFVNYILANKDKTGQSNLFYVLMSLDVLANNGFVVATRLLVLDNTGTLSAQSPTLKVAIVNALGEYISGSKLSIKSAVSPVSGATLFSTGDMNGKDGIFEVSGSVDALKRGLYDVEITAELPAGHVAPENNKIIAKVVAPITFSNLLLKVIDIDDNRVITSSGLSQIPVQTKGDLSSRFILDFHIADGTENIAIHQVFVRFTNTKTKQQVYFVAQADLNKKYTIDINIRTAATKSFGSVAGDYSVDILAGDATLSKTKVLAVANFVLELPESKEPEEDTSRTQKPEIRHLFREKEVRPPQLVSMFFTGLVLLPALVLLLVWMKLGVNLSGFTFSLAGLGFHLGLLSILALYLNFFLGTDMFVTMKYLAGVACVTFLCGQQLLSSIAAAKKAK